MIQVKETEQPLFVLQTDHTTYAMKVLENGQVEHLYYGPKANIDSSDGLTESHAFPPGNTSTYSAEYSSFSPEDMRYEASFYGKGDLRQPMMEAVYAEDGSATLDFVYDSYEAGRGREPIPGLPSSYGKEQEVETLVICMTDRNGGLKLRLYYHVYSKRDVIARHAEIINAGDKAVELKRVLSMQLDLDPREYVMHTFTGAWAREMKKNEIPVKSGMLVNSSVSGSSGSRANPYFMVSVKGAEERSGLVYGFHLVYSGNHYEAVERSAYGKVRIVSGINPSGFSWQLAPGESFHTPEALLCVSGRGFGELSRREHAFIREHIVRGFWQHKERPILLNTWEACYFDISENKLCRLGRAARSAGIELLVMDDGWFGERNDDTSSLGDWTPNLKKLPGGLKGIADKMHSLELGFGIWVEPEMVSENSELYRMHPDWAMRIPGKEHSQGRNQMFLDLCNPKVQEAVIGWFKEMLDSTGVDYVKWDMNRNFTDVYSPSLPASQQGETAHRYMLGLYHILKTVTETYPEVLFEGCASGGNRFDPGMLCYFPQIWASDDTDAMCRAEIQYGYSYGYPMNTLTAHVSDVPNHQTLRKTPMETRYAVACSGILGYECNICDLGNDEQSALREQIAIYKRWRKVLQFGDFFRGRMWKRGDGVLDNAGQDAEWTIVSRDRRRAVSCVLQCLVRPNTQQLIHYPSGLDPSLNYRMIGRTAKLDLKDFGGLVNYVAPIHVKQDGAVHNIISKFVRMQTEDEKHVMRGDVLMNAGVHLVSAFSGCGYKDGMRFYPDFSSRLYFYEAVRNAEEVAEKEKAAEKKQAKSKE